MAELGLYVHWPFCLSLCPYCDFNSHVVAEVDHRRWQRALQDELRTMAARVPGRTLASVFFGGGTPSLMEPGTVAAVLETARGLWPVTPGLEVTLEANPTSVEAGRFAAFRDAGVDRVSVGVQSLDDRALAFLGRRHDAAEAIAALEVAHARFPRVSFDLIYARPEQAPADWRAELARALALAGEHVSLYQLTIEPGTAFHRAHARGDFVMPGDRTGGILYETTVQMLHEAGLPAYEISNYAVPGAECRHNLVYWRLADYIGIGPGAWGRHSLQGGGIHATRTHRAPARWLELVERDGHAVVETTRPDRGQQVTEILMMGLRLVEGVPRSRFESVAGGPLEALVDRDTLDLLTGEGFLALDGERLRATAAGRQRLDSVLALLLRDLDLETVRTGPAQIAPEPGRGQ